MNAEDELTEKMRHVKHDVVNVCGSDRLKEFIVVVFVKDDDDVTAYFRLRVALLQLLVKVFFPLFAWEDDCISV